MRKCCHTTRRETVTALQCTATETAVGLRSCKKKFVTLVQENVVNDSALLSLSRHTDAAAGRFASSSAFETRVCVSKSGSELTFEQL